LLTHFLALLICFTIISGEQEESVEYGIDVSFPMHHARVSENYPWLPHNVDPLHNPVPAEYKDMPIQPLGNRQALYEHFMQGCVDYHGEKGKRCLRFEKERIDMSNSQPQSMVNYTQNGFKKIRCPNSVFQPLKDFWEKNRHRGTPEEWAAGRIHVNYWDNPTIMVSVEDTKLEGGGSKFKKRIWQAARDTISDWTGQQLVECSMYGIRIYQEGAILSTHVDRLPLVSSAIINVDQDVDEPWPLEVIGHDGKAYNVTMEPGDMVLYESHSILHGRPFPLKGRFMANIFVHFEAIGPVDGQVLMTGDLPPYIRPGSPEEPIWRKANPGGHKVPKKHISRGSTLAHHHAIKRDYHELRRVLDKHGHLVHVRDANGWTPLHEAVRTGDVPILQLVLDHGADVNTRTGKTGNGESALELAHEYHTAESEVVRLLKERGAKSRSEL